MHCNQSGGKVAPSSWLCILDILNDFGVESAEFLYIEKERRGRGQAVRLMIRNPGSANCGPCGRAKERRR